MVVGVGLAVVVSAVAIGFTQRVLADRAVLDVPNERSSHDVPVPRGAGIGLALALGAGWGVAGLRDVIGWGGLVVAAIGFGAIGLAEDLRRDRPILVRFGAQVLAAAAAAVLLLERSGQTGLALWSLSLLVVGWIVGLANVTNFMDGINGITAMTATVAAASMAVSGLVVAPDAEPFVLVAAVVAGAAIGFLPHNVPTARIFLGDVGSYLVGAVLAACVVLGTRAEVPLVALVSGLVPFVADSTVTLARRVLRGDRWWEPHREHAYQRLVIGGWSHAQAASAMAFSCAVAGASGVLVAADLAPTLLAVGVSAASAGAFLALPRVASRAG